MFIYNSIHINVQRSVHTSYGRRWDREEEGHTTRRVLKRIRCCTTKNARNISVEKTIFFEVRSGGLFNNFP